MSGRCNKCTLPGHDRRTCPQVGKSGYLNVTVAFQEEAYDELSDFARRNYVNRSDVIRAAVSRYIHDARKE